MAEGWICLHRKIQECVIWDSEEKFDYRSAWIDLLLLANHEDKKIMFDGKPIVVKRGQRITSVRKLADRWHWGIERTTRFLRMLEDEKMIIKESDKRRTLLTIVNYGVYNDMPNTDRYSNGTLTDTVPEHQPDTNNNDNNDNNENNDKDIEIIKNIIEYLNTKSLKNYKYSTEKNKKHIRARLKEGFKEEDFKRVIDIKCEEWMDDPKMNQYLRPETLFGTKFESYLQQKKIKAKNKTAEELDQFYDMARKWAEEGNDE